MDDFSNFTDIELVKICDDIIKNHNIIKERIINNTYKIDSIQNEINNDVAELELYEKLYVAIIEELLERGNKIDG